MVAPPLQGPLLSLYLAGHRNNIKQEFEAGEPRWVTGGQPLLIVPISFASVPLALRAWQEPHGKCGNHRWEKKDTQTSGVYDLPVGGDHVRLEVARPRYICRSCGSQNTPWPEGLISDVLMQDSAQDSEAAAANAGGSRASSPRRGRPALFTSRLFSFLVREWAVGHTHVELAAATGLPEHLVSRLTRAAGSLLRDTPEPLPSVLGIDEIYLRKRYCTVISDMSRASSPRLVDIVEGRVGDRKAPQAERDEAKRALQEALKKLARMYADKSSWREGNHLLAPILVTDGWDAFGKEVEEAFNTAADSAGLDRPELRHVGDLFHQQRTIARASMAVRNSINYYYKRDEPLVNALAGAQQLHDLIARVIHEAAKSWSAFQAITEEFQESAISFIEEQKREGLQNLKGVLFIRTRTAIHRIQKANARQDARYPSHTMQWSTLPELIATDHELLKASLSERHKTLRKQLFELVSRVAEAGAALSREGESRLSRWENALKALDEHPRSRQPGDGFPFAELDRRFRTIWFLPEHERDYSTHFGPYRRYPGEVVKAFTRSAQIRHIEIREIDLTQVRRQVPSLAERAHELVGQFSCPENRILVDGVLDSRTAEAKAINAEMRAAGHGELFRILRPSNSGAERLNRGIRRVLANSSPTSSFSELRTRLLCRFSGRLDSSSEPDREEDGPFAIPPPRVCPNCRKEKLEVSPSAYFELRWLDLPIGWRPTQYRIRTPIWRCEACGTSSPKTRNPKRIRYTDRLEAYLDELARLPRLTALPIGLWHRRTGVPGSRLRKLPTGAQGLHVPTTNDPAIVIGLSITSDAFKDAKLRKLHRVLIADLRHRNPDFPSTSERRDKTAPARPIVHDRLSVTNVIQQLKIIQRSAPQPLILVLDNAWMRDTRLRRIEKAAQQEGWRIATDANTLLNTIGRAGREALRYWQRQTRTRIEKSSRYEKSKTATHKGARAARRQAEQFMHEMFTKALANSENTAAITARFHRLVQPHPDAMHDDDYDPIDLIQFHGYLARWWVTLCNTRDQDPEALRATFARLFRSSPQLTAREIQRINDRLIVNLDRRIKYLLNAKPDPSTGVLPDTTTGAFNTAKMGPIKKQVKREAARRGRAV